MSVRMPLTVAVKIHQRRQYGRKSNTGHEKSYNFSGIKRIWLSPQLVAFCTSIKMSVCDCFALHEGWTSLTVIFFLISFNSICGYSRYSDSSNKGTKMPSKDDSTDAVHMRFRDKGLLKQFYCFDCSQSFPATQLLDVFQHYKDTQHRQFHCKCLYCDGRVYQYRDGDHKIQYYHNCFRWKQGLDK